MTPSSRDLAALGFPNSDQLDLSDWVLVDPHALAGNSTGGAGKHGFGYNSVIDVETSDEENYPLDWVDEMGSGAGASGTSGASNSNTNTTGIAVVAPHCLALLGLTLQLPLYVEVLLREERKARFLLRILLGVSDIGDSSTFQLSIPVFVFQKFYEEYFFKRGFLNGNAWAPLNFAISNSKFMIIY